MIVRSIDGSGDWNFGKGKNDYKKDLNAVSQNIRTRLQSFLGDCFFATDAGIDWFNLLGSKRIDELKLQVSSTILNTEGVVELIEVSANLGEDRTITIQYTVNTVYGPISDSLTQGAV